MKTIIIDDEPKARDNLKLLLSEYCPNVNILASEGNIKDAIASINKHQPELIFLDVQMQGETGFDLLEKLETITFEVVFTTAHHEYALKAFKFSAIDYLLKPIDIEGLRRAVQRAIERNGKQMERRMEIASDTLDQNKSSFNKIALPTSEGFVFIVKDDIVRCESTDNYTNFYLADGTKVLVSKTLKHFDEILSPYGFFRVHQSHLINLSHLQKYHKGEGGYAIMSDASSVMVSRRKKAEFLDCLSRIS